MYCTDGGSNTNTPQPFVVFFVSRSLLACLLYLLLIVVVLVAMVGILYRIIGIGTTNRFDVVIVVVLVSRGAGCHFESGASACM